jgi:hypothetical protein
MGLVGLQNSIHIAGVFELESVRAKFLETAIKFAKIENVRAVTRKEVDSIRSLAITSLFDGRYLGTDWLKVIQNSITIFKLISLNRFCNAFQIWGKFIDWEMFTKL